MNTALPRVSPVALARLVGQSWLGVLLVTALPGWAQTGDFGNSMPRGSLSTGDMPIRLDPVLIFFPPNPPPMGRAIARNAMPPSRFTAPGELAAYVKEPFYPPLSTRLSTKTLNEKLRAQLERYRAAKTALQI